MYNGSVPTTEATGSGYETKMGERKRIMLTMTPRLFKKIKELAIKNERSISKQICFMVEKGR